MTRVTASTSWQFFYFYRGYLTGALGAGARMQ
jgi:hypothetical protein